MKKAERVKLDYNKVMDRAEELGITRAELSNRCGYTDSWIYSACRNAMVIPRARLVANAIDIDLDDILEQAEPEESEIEEAAECIEEDECEENASDIVAALDRLTMAVEKLNMSVVSHGYRTTAVLEQIVDMLDVPMEESDD